MSQEFRGSGKGIAPCSVEKIHISNQVVERAKGKGSLSGSSVEQLNWPIDRRLFVSAHTRRIYMAKQLAQVCRGKGLRDEEVGGGPEGVAGLAAVSDVEAIANVVTERTKNPCAKEQLDRAWFESRDA